MINLSFLRKNRWGNKATQVVGVPLFIIEGESFVEVRISQQSIPTTSQSTVSHSFNHKYKQEKWKIITTSLTLIHSPRNRDIPRSHTLILSGSILAVHVPDTAAGDCGSPIGLFLHHKAAVSFAAARS